jgi:hypothetical protein
VHRRFVRNFQNPQNMQTTIAYAIAFASAAFLLLLWRLSQSLTVKARERIVLTITKWVVFTVPCPRMDRTSNVTILAAASVVALFAGNIAASLVAL